MPKIEGSSFRCVTVYLPLLWVKTCGSFLSILCNCLLRVKACISLFYHCLFIIKTCIYSFFSLFSQWKFVFLSISLFTIGDIFYFQSWARDNSVATMLSGHKAVCNCYFTIFIVATPSKHWGLTIFRFFSGPWLVPEAILRCLVVTRLKNCRVPSSVYFHPLTLFLTSRKK